MDVVTNHKWINLSDTIFKPFNGNRHCITCDSTYMGDKIAQVSRKEWKIICDGMA